MLTVLMVVARCNGHCCMKEEGVRCVVLAGTGSEGCQGARGGMDDGWWHRDIVDRDISRLEIWWDVMDPFHREWKGVMWLRMWMGCRLDAVGSDEIL